MLRLLWKNYEISSGANMMGNQLEGAVVIGGSIGGLLAARSLSSHCKEVVILERDVAPNGAEPRKGVPQGNHGHVLLKGGERAIESLFPGIFDELVEAGTQCIDFAEKARWLHHGVWKTRFKSGFTTHVQTRPFLESHVRRRVEAIPNVTIHYETSVTELLATPDNKTVTGVSYKQDDQLNTINADLLVDTTGRASRTPRWLANLGYDAPTESSFEPNLRYVSRLYRPKNEHDWGVMILYPKMPESKKLGVIFGVEDGQWLVTLVGYLGDHPPTDDEGFLDFAKQLASPEIHQLLQEAEPVSDITAFTYKRQRRRHFEKLDRFPDGLVVLGDAACSFDPVFGQGMSVAALQAVELDKLLGTTRGNLADFPKKFHKRIAQVADLPWKLATTETRRYPEMSKSQPLLLKFMHWYNGKIYSASESDPEVYACFLKVLHLVAGPHNLFHPKIVWRLLRHTWAERFARKKAATIPTGSVKSPELAMGRLESPIS